MIMEADDILTRIREFEKRAKVHKPKATYRPPTVEDFVPWQQVLCFDQSLGNCGWALLKSEPARLSVIACDVIKQPKFPVGVRGFAATFAKSLAMSHEIKALLERMDGQFDQVLVELPSVMGYRTESSLVAAVVISLMLDMTSEDQPLFVSRNKAAATLCGDPNASKKITGELVDSLLSDHPAKPWNEHIRDAVLLGMQHLYRRPE